MGFEALRRNRREHEGRLEADFSVREMTRFQQEQTRENRDGKSFGLLANPTEVNNDEQRAIFYRLSVAVLAP